MEGTNENEATTQRSSQLKGMRCFRDFGSWCSLGGEKPELVSSETSEALHAARLWLH